MSKIKNRSVKQILNGMIFKNNDINFSTLKIKKFVIKI
jgi:hypothetical protein